ncbi:helix-turn-helix transcriptional regulator [Pseudoduganella ginsengisoli]|uniref:Helix-turn-helix domain-containing protein n=1 Tax=Pseudoduganella ginsengisoli TaxID=1462440 RepID=A0A6L6PZF7_9BURK|nr:helix-turn-helix transcriptional regulator [Pseudoduganella ginsengisoli]MTW02765.1 helix-turn-helix domain-containing protein [Pseudoduganella ginsengisoli]
MSHTSLMIDALKRQLKAKAVTYAELGRRIGLSEPSVKRMFAQRSFTLERLEQVLDVVGMDFAELALAATNAPQLISQLTYAQEEEIIGDTKLLVVAVAALNQIPVEEIVAVYRISEAETVKYLLRLDRIGFLTLLPNNRVKLLVSRTFSWIPNGPIQTWFRQEASGDYLDTRFAGSHELMRLVSVMLSPRSTKALLERLKQVADEFSQQHQDDARLPYDQRHSITFLLAARPWLPEAFKALMR